MSLTPLPEVEELLQWELPMTQEATKSTAKSKGKEVHKRKISEAILRQERKDQERRNDPSGTQRSDRAPKPKSRE